MNSRKENKAGELIRILTILKRAGIDVERIQQIKFVNGKNISTTMADIIDDANILEDLESGGIQSDYIIGKEIRRVLGGIKGTGGYKVTEEQEEQIIELGLITREEIENARSGEKETKIEEGIRILSKLKENGIELRRMSQTKTVDGKSVSTTIADIRGIDENILKELEVYGISPDYKIGQTISYILNRIKGNENDSDDAIREQEEQIIELGLITRERIQRARKLKRIRAQRKMAKEKNEEARALERQTEAEYKKMRGKTVEGE